MEGESSSKPPCLLLKDIERELIIMEEEANKMDSVNSKVSSFKIDKDNLIMRLLLLLFRGEDMVKYRPKIGHLLSTILMGKDGLLSFIHGTCDLDSTSELKTNFDQRFRALSTVIVNMPGLCCPIEDFYHNLSLQLFKILNLSQKNSANGHLWRLASEIFSSLYNQRRSLGHDHLIKPILFSINGQEASELTAIDGIICIHRLMLSNFDSNIFIPVFPSIFVIYIILSDTLSPHRNLVKEIVINMLKYVDHSLYMLDNTINNHLQLINQYKTGIITSDDEEMLTILKADDDDDDLITDPTTDLKLIDKIVQATLTLLNDLEDEKCSKFFLLLLEKVEQSTNQLLLFSLVDCLQEKVSTLILDNPSLAIQFIINTLKRVTSNDTKSIQSIINQEELNIGEENEIDESSKMLHNDSLSTIIQIVSILVEAREKLSNDEISNIKGCKVHLEQALKKSDLTDSEKEKIVKLTNQINNLSETSKQSATNPIDHKYKEALECLNSPFMPQRAHGLIVLRNLIDSRFQSTIDDRNQLFTLIKACLSDPDSYVYLAAVNALASLSLANTDECLPALIEAYQDKLRSVRERVSVGESLVWICKYLGQMSHSYYRSVVDCFLNGLKDEHESIRVSSLSNLGQFCSSLQNSLTYCLSEIIFAIESLLKSDSCYDVKRACLMFLHIMLNGLDSDSIGVILEHLKTIYHLIKSIDSKSLGDDLIRVHAHLTLEAIDYHMKILLKPADDLIRPIKL